MLSFIVHATELFTLECVECVIDLGNSIFAVVVTSLFRYFLSHYEQTTYLFPYFAMQWPRDSTNAHYTQRGKKNIREYFVWNWFFHRQSTANSNTEKEEKTNAKSRQFN